MRILIVDDHPIVCDGLCKLLAEAIDFRDCDVAFDVDSAIQKITLLLPHLLITDIHFSGSNSGLDLIKSVRKRFPQIRILVISMLEEEIFGQRVARMGASGFLSKSELTLNIVEAVKTVMAGQIYFSAPVVKRVFESLGNGNHSLEDWHLELSNRELQILELISNGSTNREIAELLRLSQKTVDTYKQRLRSKLGIENNSQLVKYAIQWKKSVNVQADKN